MLLVQIISAVVMIIITSVLVCITWFYAKQTKEIAKTAKDQLKLSQRPYIHIDELKQDFYSVDELILTVQVRFSNKGNVPVYLNRIDVIINDELTKVNSKTTIIAQEEEDDFTFNITLFSNEVIPISITMYYKSVFETVESFTRITIDFKHDREDEFVIKECTANYVSSID